MKTGTQSIINFQWLSDKTLGSSWRKNFGRGRSAICSLYKFAQTICSIQHSGKVYAGLAVRILKCTPCGPSKGLMISWDRKRHAAFSQMRCAIPRGLGRRVRRGVPLMVPPDYMIRVSRKLKMIWSTREPKHCPVETFHVREIRITNPTQAHPDRKASSASISWGGRACATLDISCVMFP